MNILKLTDKAAELEAVKDKVIEELQYLRSLDTGGDGTRARSCSLTYANVSFFSFSWKINCEFCGLFWKI